MDEQVKRRVLEAVRRFFYEEAGYQAAALPFENIVPELNDGNADVHFIRTMQRHIAVFVSDNSRDLNVEELDISGMYLVNIDTYTVVQLTIKR